MSFTPHTPDDIKRMLSTLGLATVEEVFSEVPSPVRQTEHWNLEPGQCEWEVMGELSTLARRDEIQYCFAGAGAYQHHIPAAVWSIASRGEFLTAYTPYQAEASQGTLQTLFEYQTMMASLMGLQVSNASLYDGATALAEALLMVKRVQKKKTLHKILIPACVHPLYLETVRCICEPFDMELIEIPLSAEGGISFADLQSYDGIAIDALVLPFPNFFGQLVDVDELTDWMHAREGLVIGLVNPLAMSLLKPPGEWGQQGADIACGEGQPLGAPLAGGGPYCGFICTREAMVRQLPGRIVGRSVDLQGREAFTLTLQAREQHIRREKATSNICTNQGLLVTVSAIYMSLMGEKGLRMVAQQCHDNTVDLIARLCKIPGVKRKFTGDFFHECCLEFPCSVENIIERLAAHKIVAGIACDPYYPQLPNTLLVCATETVTSDAINLFATLIERELATC